MSTTLPPPGAVPPSPPASDAGLPQQAPDVVEESAGDLIDNIVPTYGYRMPPMVGLGGSAGAFRGLQAFFEKMPADSGMVFVVIMHLSPDHASALPQMLQKWTAMPVSQAQNDEPVLPNHVYVIPPGKQLTAIDGHLRLTDLERGHGRRVAVDLFFRSLADSHGAHAAAVVLSGADGDGTLGVKRIKERGGLTIAQDPKEAEHAGMPQAAIDTGMIDWVLPAADMPQRIVEYTARESRLQLPPERPPAGPMRRPPTEPEATFHEILIFLRTRTGRDFSYYKRATVLRRISRRMQVNGVEDMAGYLAFLRTHATEPTALLKDLLISVTNFFRDREAFEEVERLVPSLFEGKGPDDQVRVWSPACATGEEAYSLAMLLVEHARTLDAPPAIQVFGCDLDEDAVRVARSGLFPDAITADVSESRLRTFFVKEHRGYRVRRELRELVLFASHDLLKDAPFSRLDLVSCRNLLIYLNRDAQRRVLDILHFALNAHGVLFLGTSETIDDDSPLFSPLDKKHRIFLRKSTARAAVPLPAATSSLPPRPPAVPLMPEPAPASRLPGVGAAPQTAVRALAGARDAATRTEESPSFGDVHFKLIERFGAPSVLVDRDYEVLHLSESAGQFLHLTGGQPTTNLLRLVDPLLRGELRSLLFRVAHGAPTAEALGVPLEVAGVHRTLDLRVAIADDIAGGCMLVSFILRTPHEDDAPRPTPGASSEPMVQHLERELEQMKAHLRDTVEQYEASTEELKASNEELQAMNEELRSATEELETSREELQSINEELSTVNQELKQKVDELGTVNSDLANLMSATAIATLFLDRDLRVLRFTESAVPIFNLIPGDVGRPLSDLQQRIEYAELATDAARVLDKLLPVEREVKGRGDVAYLARMLPYRTHDDRIAGVVLTFVDVTERERVKRELAEDLESTERLRVAAERLAGDDGMQGIFSAIVDAAAFVTHADAGTVQLLDGDSNTLRMLAWQGFGAAMADAFAATPAGSGSPAAVALRTARRTTVDLADLPASAGDEVARMQSDLGLRCVQSTPLITRSGRPIGVISTYWRTGHQTTEREQRYLDLLARQAADAVERHIAGEHLREQMDDLSRFNAAAVGRETRMVELKKEVNALSVRLGEAPRYSLGETDPSAA